MDKNGYNSVLRLDLLEFDKISFIRLGEKNDSEFKVRFDASVGSDEKMESFKVSLGVEVNKEKEYTISISLDGYFSFNTTDSEINDEEKLKILSNNAVAIMMPYIRSELSLLTAQPNMEPIVLPPFNISEMMKKTT